VVAGLRRWYNDHLGYPYPTDAEKRHLADQLGTTVVKVTNWFANKRNRNRNGAATNVGLPHQTNYDLLGVAASPMTPSPMSNGSLLSLPPPELSAMQTRHWNTQTHAIN